jgi:hypothetical protein
MSKTVPSEPKVSADDLRSKIQSFQDGIQGKVDSKKNTLLTAGGVTLLVLLILFFLLGKRSGRKRTTFVEIRRV